MPVREEYNRSLPLPAICSLSRYVVEAQTRIRMGRQRAGLEKPQPA